MIRWEDLRRALARPWAYSARRRARMIDELGELLREDRVDVGNIGEIRRRARKVVGDFLHEAPAFEGPDVRIEGAQADEARGHLEELQEALGVEVDMEYIRRLVHACAQDREDPASREMSKRGEWIRMGMRAMAMYLLDVGQEDGDAAQFDLRDEPPPSALEQAEALANYLEYEGDYVSKGLARSLFRSLDPDDEYQRPVAANQGLMLEHAGLSYVALIAHGFLEAYSQDPQNSDRRRQVAQTLSDYLREKAVGSDG